MRDRLRNLDWVLVAVIAAAVIVGAKNGLKDNRSGTPRPSAVRQSGDLLNAIDNAELCHRVRTGRYTDNIADLEETMWRLDPDGFGERLNQGASSAGLTLVLRTSDNGGSYSQRITGRGQDLDGARHGKTIVFRRDGTHSLASDDCRATRIVKPKTS